MLSYQNDPSLKARFIGHVEAHRKADQLVQGTYGDELDGLFRGCAVGCSLNSLNEIEGKASATNDHADLAKRLGIPLVLAFLEDRIFEGLPQAEAMLWPTLFARAIPVGADLTLVWPRFAHWLLVDEHAGVIRFAETERARAAINGVAELFALQGKGEVVTLEEWHKAGGAASAAAYAAADVAASAAAYAADVAAYAAAAYARQKHYVKMAEKLLLLMSDCAVSP